MTDIQKSLRSIGDGVTSELLRQENESLRRENDLLQTTIRRITRRYERLRGNEHNDDVHEVGEGEVNRWPSWDSSGFPRFPSEDS